MILYELLESESHPIYKGLADENLERQYDFLVSIVKASISAERHMISTALLKALNYHAIACLHVNAGEYRPCCVNVGKDFQPPAFHRVPALMDHFINDVNGNWESTDGWSLSAYSLWRLNHIHPFINGNGRTARALCYYVICMKAGGFIPGSIILPKLMLEHRDEYVRLLKQADKRCQEADANFLVDLRKFIMRLALQQVD